MKLDQAMFCTECNEVFAFELVTNGVKKVNQADCPSCSNTNTLFLSNFIARENKHSYELKCDNSQCHVGEVKEDLYLKYKKNDDKGCVSYD